jgi:DNA polymerase-3 subunit delta
MSNSKTEIAKVYILSGADDAAKRKRLDAIVSEVIDPGFADFDYQSIEGRDATAEKIISACTAAPIASNRRVVAVTLANEMPSDQQKELAQKFNLLPEYACLVLIEHPPVVKDGKARKGSMLETELTTAVKKVGQIVDFPLMKDSEATSFVKKLVSEAGKTITTTTAAMIVRRCGSDSGLLSNEVTKLVNFIGDRTEITDADVERLVPETVEDTIFKLIDAVGMRKARSALSYLEPLLYSAGANPQAAALRVLAMLARHFRHIWQARVLLDAGCRTIAPNKIPPAFYDLLPDTDNLLKLREFQIINAVKQARMFTLKELASAMEHIAATDLALKGADTEGGISDPATAMEILVLKLSAG